MEQFIATKPQNQIAVQSSLKNLPLVENFIDNIFEINNLSEELYAKINICITHAVKNAIQHGNKNNEKKLTQIHYELCEKKLSFTIKDEGMGFDYKDIETKQMQIKDGYFSPGGLFLIHYLSDSWSLSDHGSTINIEFNIKGTY